MLLPLTLMAAGLAAPVAAEYVPTWPSTDQHTPAPEWFKDAKLGVYWHWGAFTTPEYSFEWYPRNMYRPGDGSNTHHIATYGNPDSVFPYEDFILGGKDLKGNPVQFKPVLKSAGGQFDPHAWMAAIKSSGARYAGPVAEHHDGYSLWNSSVNEWNAARLGPEIDLVRLFADLVRENGLKVVVAMHQAFNVNGYFAAAPNQTDPSLRRLFGQFGGNRTAASEWWLAKQLDVMDHVQPDLIYNDFALDSPGYCQGDDDICAINEAQRLEFLATYWNRGVSWGKEVLTTYKHFDSGFRTTSAVADWERGGPAELTRPYWQADDSISSSSWSYVVGISYYNAKQMIHSLLDRVSKNGNLLLNISPTAAGVLPDQQITVLQQIGAFMSRYGESVYGTRAWDIYGEGPNKAGGGSFTAPLQGNSSDIRFVKTKDGKTLYATLLGWPGSSAVVNIASLGSSRNVELQGLTSVQLLGDTAGSYHNISTWKQVSGGLQVTMPTAAEYSPAEAVAYVLKLTFQDGIPVPQPAQGATVWTAGNAKGVTLGLGDFTSVFVDEAGIAPGQITLVRLSTGSTATLYASGDLSGSPVTVLSTQGDHAVQAGSVNSLKIAAQ